MDITQLLKGKNISKTARELGVSRVTVSRWVNGHCIPNGAQLIALIDFLGYTLTRKSDTV